MPKNRSRTVYRAADPQLLPSLLQKTGQPETLLEEAESAVREALAFFEKHPYVVSMLIQLRKLSAGFPEPWEHADGSIVAWASWARKSKNSLALVMHQEFGRPISAKLEQQLFPCGVTREGLVPNTDRFGLSLRLAPVAQSRGRPGQVCPGCVALLVLSMQYDLGSPLAPQIYTFVQESELVVRQYCQAITECPLEDQ